MLGGLLFGFWRLAEIITLIPVIGMLVCIHLIFWSTRTKYLTGIFRPRLQSEQPAYAFLHPCPLHRLDPCLRMGHCDTRPPGLH